MNQVSNPSVAELTKILLVQLQENGFAVSAMDRANRFAKYLSDFMEQNALQTYDESVGFNFLNDICHRRAASTQNNLKLLLPR